MSNSSRPTALSRPNKKMLQQIASDINQSYRDALDACTSASEREQVRREHAVEVAMYRKIRRELKASVDLRGSSARYYMFMSSIAALRKTHKGEDAFDWRQARTTIEKQAGITTRTIYHPDLVLKYPQAFPNTSYRKHALRELLAACDDPTIEL